MKTFSRCIAIATEQEKDKNMGVKDILKQILRTQDEFLARQIEKQRLLVKISEKITTFHRF